jgi:serine protease
MDEKHDHGRGRGPAPRRIIVKLYDDVELPRGADPLEYVLARGRHDGARRPSGEEGVKAYEPDAATHDCGSRGPFARPLFDHEQMDELVRQARAGDPSYCPPNFQNFLAVYPEGADHESVEGLVHRLSGRAVVEYAYSEPPPGKPPSVDIAGDELAVGQHHLNAAPQGIDAYAAWRCPGGDGSRVSFVDLERGWALPHEDLPPIADISGAGAAYADLGHGTRVLGVVLAADNTTGIVGIAPRTKSPRVISSLRQSDAGAYDAYPETITNASLAMQPGDVLLLEASVDWKLPGNVKKAMPIEIAGATREVIRAAVAKGVIVIEAAGDGGYNLDNLAVSGKYILNSNSSNFQESGAILVGGASSTYPHVRSSESNYGSRIDCYGWGDSVRTTKYVLDEPQGSLYVDFFNGTSSAAAIVAGVAICLQSIVKASGAPPLKAEALRALLRLHGTPVWSPGTARTAAAAVGLIPDLTKLITLGLGLPLIA